MYNKYLKYKLKYNSLKGGLIEPSREIQEDEYHILTSVSNIFNFTIKNIRNRFNQNNRL